MNAVEADGAYQLSHLYDQLIQRTSLKDDITVSRRVDVVPRSSAMPFKFEKTS